ncbi:MAG: M6 family metalloprotease domain-containing protein [bacterium]
MKVFAWVISTIITINFLLAIPLSPELENRLNQEGRLTEVIKQLQQAKEKGVDAPNPTHYKAAPGEQTTLHAVAILVDFSDNVGTTPSAHFDSLLASQGTYPTGSFRDFYLENSYNNVDVVMTVVGWFRLPQTYAYYVNGQYGFGSYPMNAQRMAEDAVWAADPTVDFSLFDNDNNGYIDALFIVHAGSGAEQTGSVNDIWSHAWVTVNVPYVDGVYAYGYSTEPENGKIGVFCHEAGHNVFGLPDLYDYDYDSYGTGRWSLMSNGSWNGGGLSPAHLDAWCKIDAGFVTPQVPTTNQTGVLFPRVMDNPVVYKLWSYGTPGLQYFLVENRQLVGFDAYLPYAGMLIYHVDDAQSTNNNQWYPGHTTYGHYHVAVEQSDGAWHLEQYINAGDVNDPWPGTLNRRTFNDTTIPDTKDYSFATTYVAVENISNSSDTMTADIYVRPVGIEEEMSTEKNLSLFQVSPSIGTKNFTISFFQQDRNDNITAKILDASGRIVKKYNQVNKGSITWNGNDNIGERVSPGVYFVYVEYMGSDRTKNAAEVKQIIVLD